MALGPLFFAAPWALAALAALPLLIWLLRATPPPPVRAMFPPLRLLLDLRTEETQRHRAPWWLVLVRAVVASLLILGFAKPSWRPPGAQAAAAGPLLLVVDDGWTSAPHWPSLRTAALAAVEETAQAGGGPVTIVTTTPRLAETGPLEALAIPDAKARLLQMQPVAWRPDRSVAAEQLGRYGGEGRAIWLSDGLEATGDDRLRGILSRTSALAVWTPEQTANAVTNVASTPDGLEVRVRRGSRGARAGAIAVEAQDGRSLAAAEFEFPAGRDDAQVAIAAPATIAARAARVRLVQEASAGGVRALSGGAGRPVVGLSAPGGGDQPLLRELYYLERAIAPFAATRTADLTDLLDGDVQALILADVGRLQDQQADRLRAWVEQGGLLIRFAGPRLAADPDTLLPSPLRLGARTLGGALAWEQPQPLAPFPVDSPFAGLETSQDLRVRQQVLADPVGLGAARVWARLADGTPVVTATPMDRGLLVLFHVTAGPSWSDLPLSGLYVEMLQRVLAFAGDPEAASGEARAGPWTAERVFDGRGRLQRPTAAISVPHERLMAQTPGPDAPPGIYVREGSPRVVLSAATADERLAPLVPPPGARLLSSEAARAAPLAGWLLGAAGLLMALDLLLALALAGRFRLTRPAAAALGLAIAAGLGGGADAQAQTQLGFPPGWGIQTEAAPQQIQNPGDVQLAFVHTGDARQDSVTRAGLEALRQILIDRTAVEPGPVVEVRLESDDLSAYPLLYWSAPARASALSSAAAANLERYMQLGGMVVLDTRGQSGATTADAARLLLEGVDAPPLAPLSATDSVYGKSFYLLRAFPGRRRGAQVWAESAEAAAARDGVASLIVGDGDWASAWAGVEQIGTSSARQREMALRFGVNLVMVALTGNYKADQVHVPELLRRLGEGRARP